VFGTTCPLTQNQSPPLFVSHLCKRIYTSSNVIRSVVERGLVIPFMIPFRHLSVQQRVPLGAKRARAAVAKKGANTGLWYPPATWSSTRSGQRQRYTRHVRIVKGHLLKTQARYLSREMDHVNLVTLIVIVA
jgi:hypothetical protein